MLLLDVVVQNWAIPLCPAVALLYVVAPCKLNSFQELREVLRRVLQVLCAIQVPQERQEFLLQALIAPCSG